MKKAHVDAAVQSASSIDSSLSAHEVSSSTSRRKSVLPVENCETRAEKQNEQNEQSESSVGKKATSKGSAKKTSKSKPKPTIEQVDSEAPVDLETTANLETMVVTETTIDSEITTDDPYSLPNAFLGEEDVADVQTSFADPFNESNDVPEPDAYNDALYDAQPSSDRFFCSDEKFNDAFDDGLLDDFDDDFDEDFVKLDDSELIDLLDEAYDEVDDSLEDSDDENDPNDDSSDDDDFDNFNSDEDVIEDEEEDF